MYFRPCVVLLNQSPVSPRTLLSFFSYLSLSLVDIYTLDYLPSREDTGFVCVCIWYFITRLFFSLSLYNKQNNLFASKICITDSHRLLRSCYRVNSGAAQETRLLMLLGCFFSIHT